MRTDGFDAQIEGVRDVRHGHPAAEETENLELAIGETFVRRDGAAGVGHARGQPLREFGTDIHAPGCDAVNGSEQFRRRVVLLHVSGSARAQCPFREQILAMHAEDEDAHAWELAAQMFDEIETAPQTEAEIEDDHIDRSRSHEREQFVSRSRFADHAQIGSVGNDLPQSLADYCMIVGERDPGHGVTSGAIIAPASGHSSMPSNRQIPPVLAYAAAIAIPITLGLGWAEVDARMRGVTGYVFVV